MEIRSRLNDYLKPKIVKIGPVMNSGGAAQNMKIFFYNRLNVNGGLEAKLGMNDLR